MCCSSMFKNSTQHTALSYLPERLHYRILSPEPAEPLPALSSPRAGFFFVEGVQAVCAIHFTPGPCPARLVSLVARGPSEAPGKAIVFHGVLILFILWDLCGNFALPQNEQLEPEAGPPAPPPSGVQAPGPSSPRNQPSSSSGGQRKPGCGWSRETWALLLALLGRGGGGSLHPLETRFSQL